MRWHFRRSFSIIFSLVRVSSWKNLTVARMMTGSLNGCRAFLMGDACKFVRVFHPLEMKLATSDLYGH